MKLKRLTALLLSVMLVLSLAACGGGKDAKDDSADGDLSGKEIIIGNITPVTGAQAAYGLAITNSIQMAIDEINADGGILGATVKLSTKDDQGTPAEAVSGFNSLLSEGAAAIIGATLSSCTSAITSLADDEGIVLVTPSSTADSITTTDDYVFRSCFKDSFQGEMVAAYAKDQGWTKAAVLYATGDTYSSGLHDSFVKAAEKYGIDISDEALMKAIELHNEVSAVINEIGDYRKLDNPTITGYEFHVIQLCSQVCPKDLILPMLKETAKELKTRKPDKKSPFRCKVVLAGSENDDPEFTKLIEGCGAEVVCDRYCYGAVESRMPIEVKDGEKPLTAIARHYLETSNCPRFMPQDIMRERKQRLADLAKEYKADGIIVASNKFCEYWSYERTIDTIVLPRDFGYPVCSIEKEYINSASGQLRTRFQAFVESIEIKKIQEGK